MINHTRPFIIPPPIAYNTHQTGNILSATSHSDVQYKEKSMDYTSLCDEADYIIINEVVYYN